MSVTTPDLFKTVESKDADTKVIFTENEYITHPFHIEENLVKKLYSVTSCISCTKCLLMRFSWSVGCG